MNDFDDFLIIVIVAAIAVHVVFGYISARVAGNKGRNPLLGFLAGLLLNIFGLIIVMLMRPSVEAEARRRIEVEREYDRQRQPVAPRPVAPRAARVTREAESQHSMADVDRAFAAAGATKEAEGLHRMVLSIQRIRYGDVVDINVVVLSTPYQRTEGQGILASEAATGALHFWPEGGMYQVQFWNALPRIEVRVALIDTRGKIDEILTLTPGDASTVEPTNPVAAALAFRASRFGELGIDIGDQVLIPDEIRALAD